MKNLSLFILCLVLPSLTFASSQWPNEPAGASLINDWGHDAVGGNGWFDVYDMTGWQTTIVQDPTAPLSPSNVMRQRFPQGLAGGYGGGGGSFYKFPNFTTSVYWGFWIKTDPNYEQHPVFTKIGWIHTGIGGAGDGNQLFFGLEGDGPLYINANYQNADTDNAQIGQGFGTIRLEPNGGAFNKGQWARFETCFQPSTCPTCQNGVWKVWVNGQMTINVSNLNTQALRPTSVSHITIWGGMGSVKTRESYLYWDHEHISAVPNCTGAPGSVDTPPVKQLAKPTNLKII